MNRRGFLRLAAAMPVVGPAAIKAASLQAEPWQLEPLLRGGWTLTQARPVIYMNRTVYQWFVQAKICRQVYLDQFKILGIAPPEELA